MHFLFQYLNILNIGCFLMPNIQYFSYFAKKVFCTKTYIFEYHCFSLNNCLLESRKLEILKCESLKSCVSKKKRNPSSAQITVELCPWENHLCQKLFIRAAIIVGILCNFKCLVFHIKYISIINCIRKTFFDSLQVSERLMEKQKWRF